MKIGIPKEVKNHEYRVGLLPAGVHELVVSGHEVLVQAGAGDGSGFTDQEYRDAGADVVASVDKVWSESEMIVKVKEPVAEEHDRLQEGQLLFTYLHLAPLPELTDVLTAKRITGIAYETITDRQGYLPLLTPMSEIAGRMSVMVGAHYLHRVYGGRGVLISGVPGVPPGDVVILGGGIVGINSIKMAVGLGASVTVLETNHDRMRHIDDLFHGTIRLPGARECQPTSIAAEPGRRCLPHRKTPAASAAHIHRLSTGTTASPSRIASAPPPTNSARCASLSLKPRRIRRIGPGSKMPGWLWAKRRGLPPAPAVNTWESQRTSPQEESWPTRPHRCPESRSPSWWPECSGSCSRSRSVLPGGKKPSSQPMVATTLGSLIVHARRIRSPRWAVARSQNRANRSAVAGSAWTASFDASTTAGSASSESTTGGRSPAASIRSSAGAECVNRPIEMRSTPV